MAQVIESFLLNMLIFLSPRYIAVLFRKFSSIIKSKIDSLTLKVFLISPLLST
ncbi:MAG: hypothetical protein ACJAYJ_002331 [Saprospiraceae bacterium]|jgi:hypothetical protein